MYGSVEAVVLLHNYPGACYTPKRPDRTVWAFLGKNFYSPISCGVHMQLPYPISFINSSTFFWYPNKMESALEEFKNILYFSDVVC